MREELEKHLVKTFPHVFLRDSNGREPWSMFGIECGDGWYDLLEEGAAKLEPLFAAAAKADPEGYGYGYFRTTQIKEKYGTLRWYLSGASDEMYAIVDAAEERSSTTCEQCGEHGTLRGGGWLYTACYTHTREEDLNRFERIRALFERVLLGVKHDKE